MSRLSAWRLLVNNRLGLAGLVVFGLCVLLALVTPWLPLPDPDSFHLWSGYRSRVCHKMF